MGLLTKFWPQALFAIFIALAIVSVNHMRTTIQSQRQTIELKKTEITNLTSTLANAKQTNSDNQLLINNLLDDIKKEQSATLQLRAALSQNKQKLATAIDQFKRDLQNETKPTDCAYQLVPNAVVKLLNQTTRDPIHNQDKNSNQKD